MKAVEKESGCRHFPWSMKGFLTQAFTGHIMDLFLKTQNHVHMTVIIIEGFKFHCM